MIGVQAEWGADDKFRQQLQGIYNAFETPEHINDSFETKPSKRLEEILKYKKTLHGPLIAEQIGLVKIEAECRHFRKWMDCLRSFCESPQF